MILLLCGPVEKPKKETDLSVGQQRVHSLEEARLHDVGLVQDEADLLVLAAGPAENVSEVFVEILGGVLVVNLDLWTKGSPCQTCSTFGNL